MGSSAKGGKGVPRVGKGGVSVAVSLVGKAMALGVVVPVSSGMGVLRGAGGSDWQPAMSPTKKAIRKILPAWGNKRCKLVQGPHILTS